MAHRFITTLIFVFAATSILAEEQQAPTTEVLESALIDGIASEDMVAFAQC